MDLSEYNLGIEVKLSTANKNSSNIFNSLIAKLKVYLDHKHSLKDIR